jgi:glycosyltransferase involved in cell wall biosynthesis
LLDCLKSLGLKVVIISNDFRVYWRGRLIYLHGFLADNDIQMQAVELFGKGSPYSFDEFDGQHSWWTCLFPESDATELTPSKIATRLFGELDLMEPDVVIASPITFFAGALGLRWAKKNNKKHIMFDDAKPRLQFKRNFFVRWIRDTITAQSDALWLPSADYDKHYPAVKKGKSLIFYGFNCIDNDFFKSRYPKKFTSKTVVCIARLVPVKNLDRLLHAWKIIEAEANDWKLYIIGDGPLYERLFKLTNQLELKNVSIMGTINYPLLPDYLHRAEALILPSLSETWGLVVNEAMAAGLPILLSDKVNAAESLLTDGINGYVFNPDDVEAIKGAIEKFIKLNTFEKSRMSEQSLQIIERMDYQNMGNRLLSALKLITTLKFRRPALIAGLFINLWPGKHDISAWNNLKS